MSTTTTELRRFLTITGQRLKAGRPMPEMFSPAVDAAWHDMHGTTDYKVLCQETAGQPIRHVANIGHGPIAWVTAYEAAYGPLPDIWFTNADGTVDELALSWPWPATARPAPWSPSGTAAPPAATATTPRPTSRRPPAGEHLPHHTSAPAHRRGGCASSKPAPPPRPPSTSRRTYDR
ncbi:hypothetical protein ACFVGY_19660 [Streptomyces sp. NPDC127106]|uniref:hypothetical protein n=1 Tax=Streptomyces sp. NPDC127106 TaxID=3345360 RepID=UPI00364335D2